MLCTRYYFNCDLTDADPTLKPCAQISYNRLYKVRLILDVSSLKWGANLTAYQLEKSSKNQEVCQTKKGIKDRQSDDDDGATCSLSGCDLKARRRVVLKVIPPDMPLPHQLLRHSVFLARSTVARAFCSSTPTLPPKVPGVEIRRDPKKGQCRIHRMRLTVFLFPEKN